MEHDQRMCLCYQNPDDGSKINDREVQKSTHKKSKGQFKDKIVSQKKFIYFPAQQWLQNTLHRHSHWLAVD